jgi:ABC-2 type transport system ATP-binding protein
MIEAEELTKVFRVRRRAAPGLWGAVRGLWPGATTEIRALDRLTFTAGEGSRTALLGRNGAGKSTTIKLLAGVLTATSGRCRVAGRDPRQDRRAHAHAIGVVFGQRSQLWWDLPVDESFRILARIYAIPPVLARANRALFDDVLDLGAIADQPVRTLSLGQRMRAEVAAALFHAPRVLLLDEPTIGLDLLLKDAVRELVNRVVAERATTVLLTSHDVGDISALCDRVVVLDEARPVYDAGLTDLLRSAPNRTVRLDWSGPPDAAALAVAVAAHLPPAARCVPVGRRRLEVVGPSEAVGPGAVLAAIGGQVTVTDLVAPEPTLAEVLKALYHRTGQAAAGTAVGTGDPVS